MFWLSFIIGMFAGGAGVLIFMCCLNINRES